jgi:poly(U)-specific endoribonuclease
LYSYPLPRDIIYNPYADADNGERLFTNVNEAIFQAPVYGAFIRLRAFYKSERGIPDCDNYPCWTELFRHRDVFLHAVTQTPVMIRTAQFLGIPLEHMKALLSDLWFTPYSTIRNPYVLDSSGFEHVFLGETIRGDGTLKGFHNWIQLYLEERVGNLYFGRVVRQCPVRNDVLFNVDAFDGTIWKGHVKRHGSMFIGTSPELEMAMYTICFLKQPGVCKFWVNGNLITIKTHIQNRDTYNPNNLFQPNLNLVATAYPEC